MNLFGLISGLLVMIVFIQTVTSSTPESSEYVAAVVEYHPIRIGESNQEIVNGRTNEYLEFIAHTDANEADIIVFPESTLTPTRLPQFVPNPEDNHIPCDMNEYSIDNPVKNISCAAKQYQKYVVINLTMKRNCTEEKVINNDDRACALDGWNLYNTNVVFDRKGQVISIYRKVNLFGESVNTTLIPDISSFDTDFGVTFGHFICFDLMFDTPTFELLNKGIRNFVFPTMWFAEIPFLSGVQAQQGWAYANNVNFLGAGANNPGIGSTGSGIYSGKQGALKSLMTGSNESRLLVSRINKLPGTNPSDRLQIASTTVQHIYLKRDQLDLYSMISINASVEEQHHNICHNEFCCNFNLQLNDLGETQNAQTYEYVIAAYRGNRTFDGFADGDVQSCSIFACRDNLNISTCGQIFANDATVTNRYVFNKIEITGTFLLNETIVIPSTLTTALLPLNSDRYSYEPSEQYFIENLSYSNVTMKYIPESGRTAQLLTFGIYVREFEISSSESMIPMIILITLGVILNVLR